MNLLLSAFPPEIEGICNFGFWHAACTGIGAIESAISVTRLIAEYEPERVLFIGTCGALDHTLSVGDIQCVEKVISTSVEELKGKAYKPSLEITEWNANYKLPFRGAIVASTPAITKSESGALLLGKIAQVEHLEISGVFAACHRAKVPVGAVLVVANRVGPGAHEEWLANNERVSKELVKAISGFCLALN